VRGTDMLIVARADRGSLLRRAARHRGDGEQPGGAQHDGLFGDRDQADRPGRLRGGARPAQKGDSVDKANILEVSVLWREVVTEMGRDYPDVRSTIFTSTTRRCRCCRARRSSTSFDENTFGDILSDEGAMLAGGIGMLPSASLGEGTGLYEPVHGSAPDIAGRGVANPLAAILSAAMLLRALS